MVDFYPFLWYNYLIDEIRIAPISKSVSLVL